MIEQGGDLSGGEALGDGEAVLHRLGGAQNRQHVPQAGIGGEDEFRRAQRAAAGGEHGGDVEAAGVTDQAGFLQRLTHFGMGAMRHDDRARLLERSGRQIALTGLTERHGAADGEAAENRQRQYERTQAH